MTPSIKAGTFISSFTGDCYRAKQDVYWNNMWHSYSSYISDFNGLSEEDYEYLIRDDAHYILFLVALGILEYVPSYEIKTGKLLEPHFALFTKDEMGKDRLRFKGKDYYKGNYYREKDTFILTDTGSTIVMEAVRDFNMDECRERYKVWLEGFGNPIGRLQGVGFFSEYLKFIEVAKYKVASLEDEVGRVTSYEPCFEITDNTISGDGCYYKRGESV